MRGNKLAKMDDRGRLKIPRDFLKELREAYGPAVYVTSITGQSAWVYPLPVWEAIESRLRDLPSTFKGRQKYLSRTSYFGNEASIDAQGRLLIHPLLRKTAGISFFPNRIAFAFRKAAWENSSKAGSRSSWSCAQDVSMRPERLPVVLPGRK